jgi:hypothetical protein
MSEEPNLGPCCACGKEGPDVRNIVMLDKLAPIPGKGWGCFVCGLPNDGAVAVLCDRCLEQEREPIMACRGYPGIDGRVPIEDITGDFRHNMALHSADII